jgi:hypothetical protein
MKLVVIFFYLGSPLFFTMLQMKLVVILFYLRSSPASDPACSSPVGSLTYFFFSTRNQRRARSLLVSNSNVKRDVPECTSSISV